MDIAIVGGGASGLMAALSAAERGYCVRLLERQSRVGRKLLATGNGRCNLSNLHLSLQNYHGNEPTFAACALHQFGPQAALDFFHNLGLLTVCQPDGRVYPFSDQAGSVVDVLRFAAQARGVRIETAAEVVQIRVLPDGFALRLAGGKEKILAEKLIVCCGGLAGSRLGGSRSGYDLLGALGHSCTPLYPALVQLKTDTSFVRALKGVRADAALCLTQNDMPVATSAGEVQFTEYGLSGPATFELSRFVSFSSGKLLVRLDLLRAMRMDAVEAALAERQRDYPALTLENLLTGMLHNRLGQTVVRYAGFSLNQSVCTLSPADRKKIAAAVKAFILPVTGTMGFDHAQVTAGGLCTEQFNPETLESRVVPGIYAAGELLDVDGDCGGYNLQWAWASGRLAGRLL